MSDKPLEITADSQIDLETVQIELINFDQYRSKKGIKQGLWFRLDCDILSNRKVLKLTPKQCLLYLHIISRCTRKQLSVCGVNPQVMSRECRVAIRLISKNLFAIQQAGLINLIPYNTIQYKPIQTNTIQNQKSSSDPPKTTDIQNVVELKRPGDRCARNLHGEVASINPPPVMPDIVDLWRRICGKKYATPNLLGHVDQGRLIARWAEHCDVKIWEKAFENLASDKCTYLQPEWQQKTTWRPTFSWLIKDSDEKLMKAFNGDILISEMQKKPGWDIDALAREVEREYKA